MPLGQGKIGLRLLHLFQGGVAVDGAVVLHADSAEAVGKNQILGQALAGKLWQLGGGHAVPLQLPQKRADKAVSRAGGGTRTHTVSLPTDFESVTSTNSITPAGGHWFIIQEAFGKFKREFALYRIKMNRP